MRALLEETRRGFFPSPPSLREIDSRSHIIIAVTWWIMNFPQSRSSKRSSGEDETASETDPKKAGAFKSL